MTLIGSAVHLRDGSKGTIIGIRQNRPWFADIENATDGSRSISTSDVTIEGESFAQWLMRYDIPQDRDGWSKLVQMCSPTDAISQPATTQPQPPTRLHATHQYGAGLIKWCGGRNTNTGKENDYGFIETKYGDLYFHRSNVISPWIDLRSDVRVLYRRIKGHKDQLAAGEVRILDNLSDHELLACIKANDGSGVMPLDQQLLALFVAEDDRLLRTEVVIRLARTGSTETLSRLAEQMTATLAPDVQAALLEKLDAQLLLRPEAAMLRSILPFHKHLKALIELTTLTGYEAEALAAFKKPDASYSIEKAAQALFWEKFPPVSPKDPFFPIAPPAVKTKVCQQHYSTFRSMLRDLFASTTGVKVSLNAEALYQGLDERDNLLAKEWAGENSYDAVMAQMLSARAAEKAAKLFYEGLGATVEDVSIRQLELQNREWTTHDLLVNSTVPVDVKNARRPVSGTRFYVEHTIPRFKLDRRNAHVQIAGILSPYLNYENIQKPSEASFKIEDLIFLGETSQKTINRLTAAFCSAEFEVTRIYERTVPNWVFTYPKPWYRTFSENVRQFMDECEWPEDEEWEYVLDESEGLAGIPALCIAGKPLPTVIASMLSGWQVNFYDKLRLLVGNIPEVPVIFLAVLTDFLGRLKNGETDYSPDGYIPLLFPNRPRYSVSLPRSEPSYPLGAIDPLGLVAGLIQTLSTLWKGRKNTNLERFSNFRFSGLGMLQGRERDRRDWTTIIAYCGGTAYQTDGAGKVLLTTEGKPRGIKGKCGNVPLILGDSVACTICGKLVCKKCGFCSLPCQERQFAEEAENSKRQKVATHVHADYCGDSDPRWMEIPLEAYEDEFRRA